MLEAVALALLSIYVFIARFNNRVNRALALFLLLRAALNFASGLWIDPDTRTLGDRLLPYPSLALPFAALHFALAYRNRYRSTPYPRVLGLAFLVTTLALEAAYVVDHAWWQTDGGAQDGPLAIVGGLAPASYLLLAFVFARDYFSATGSRRRSLLILAVGFALDAQYLSLTTVGGLLLGADILQNGPIYQPLWGLTAVPALLFFAWCTQKWRQSRTDDRPALARAVLFQSIALLSAVAVTIIFTLPGIGGDLSIGIAVDAVWTLWMPAAAAYALLRHQMFDFDQRVRWTISRGTLAGFYVAVLFIVSQVTQNYFSTQYNWLVAGVVTGLLLFALNPLNRVAERVGQLSVPGKRIESLASDERLRIYQEQAEIAWGTGA